MFQRPIPIEHIAPWVVSGASGLYIMARARRLSRAHASRAPLTHFLVHQSDVLFMLCGSPAVWYLMHRRPHMRGAEAHALALGPQAYAVHQLRQIFTALQLGTGLLVRKVATGKTSELAGLAQRLNKIVRDGIEMLEALGEPYPPDLIDEHGGLRVRQISGNGL